MCNSTVAGTQSASNCFTSLEREATGWRQTWTQMMMIWRQVGGRLLFEGGLRGQVSLFAHGGQWYTNQLRLLLRVATNMQTTILRMWMLFHSEKCGVA